MKIKVLKIALFVFVGLIHIGLMGQDGQNPRKSEIFVIAKSYGDSIVLRWAPDKASAWMLGNSYGYLVERGTIGRDTTFFRAEFARISPDTLKTWSLEKMLDYFAPEDNFAAITAQAVYGESFTPQTNNLGTQGIFDLAMEQENRYSFSLFAADNDARVADALGLRFVDRYVVHNETYLYRIIPLTSPEKYAIDTGYVTVSVADMADIPTPPDITATGLEYSVELQWDISFHREAFTGYYIEKGNRRERNWQRLNDMPLILATPDEAYQEAYLYSYTDSLEENYKPASYRIVGVTPFGELSEPSNVVIAYGQDRTPPSPPVDINAINNSEESIKVTWKKDNIEDDLEGIYIRKADSPDGPFLFLNETPIPPQTNSYTDSTNIYLENYYQVVAVDTAGNASPSLVAYAAIIDSIPPAMPVGLTGDIDTMGVVTLNWETGKDPDLMGYRVFFTNQADHEFSNLTPYPLQDTVFTDTIVIKTLTEEIFYRVVAVDQRYNHSVPSEVLKLKRPDIVPPVMPAFKDILVTDTAVYLNWINSSSKDAVTTLLYRKMENEPEWELIFESAMDSMNLRNYTDKDVKAKTIYFYTLEAMDDDSLVSGKCMPVSARIYDTGMRDDIENFEVRYDSSSGKMELSWNYPQNEEHYYVIYRSFNGSDFTVYKSVSGTENNFVDNDLLGSGSYEYAVMALYDDGGQSKLTDKLQVVIE